MVDVNETRRAVAALRHARRLVENGWRQEGYGGPAQGRYCLVGAISRATTACSVPPFQLPALETWNDAPGRTQADVLALLDKAIELGERQVAKAELFEKLAALPPMTHGAFAAPGFDDA